MNITSASVERTYRISYLKDGALVTNDIQVCGDWKALMASIELVTGIRRDDPIPTGLAVRELVDLKYYRGEA
jgi:hypothetical protein